MKLKVAIDVGTSYIKLIEGCEKKGKLLIKKIAILPNPVPDIKENMIERDHDSFSRTLREFLRKNGIGSSACVTGISGQGAIIHYFDIPELPEEELKSAVNLELMQVTPGGTKNLEYDYHVFKGKDKKNTALFIGYPRERCEFYINSLQRAGLKPLVMDHDSLAILNAFKFLHPQKDDIPFLLNIGERGTNFFLSSKDGMTVIRDIAFGCRHITEAIAASKNISFEEAEIFKNKADSAEEIKNIISTDMEDLISEVSASLDYFRTRTMENPLKLFITGGGAFFPGVAEAFQQALNIEVSRWNPFEQLKERKFSLDKEMLKSGTVFSVAIGLLLRNF